MSIDIEALERIAGRMNNAERAEDYAHKQTNPRIDSQGRRMRNGARRATKTWLMYGPIRHLRAFVSPTRIGAKRAFLALAFPQYDPARLDGWTERQLDEVMRGKGYKCREVN